MVELKGRARTMTTTTERNLLFNRIYFDGRIFNQQISPFVTVYNGETDEIEQNDTEEEVFEFGS